MMKIEDLSNIRVANEKWKEIENSLSEERKEDRKDWSFFRWVDERRKSRRCGIFERRAKKKWRRLGI